VNKVSADYDSITEFFEDVHTYLEQLQVLEPHIAGSTELQAVTVKIFAAVLEFCGVCTKHVQMRRRCKCVCRMPEVASHKLITDTPNSENLADSSAWRRCKSSGGKEEVPSGM